MVIENNQLLWSFITFFFNHSKLCLTKDRQKPLKMILAPHNLVVLHQT